jgi:hypothetical protein
MPLVMVLEHPVERGLRRQVDAFIGQLWHDLARRQMSMIRTVAGGQHGALLGLAQFVAGHWPQCGRACIHLHLITLRPAL